MVPLGLALFFAGGCVVCPVGEPKRWTTTETLRETARQPARSEITDVSAVMAQPSADTFRVSLLAWFQDEYPRTEQKKSVTTTEQRLLACGFFPGAAEEYCMPEGAKPLRCMEPDYATAFVLGALPCGVFVALGTAEALVFELPFGSYECPKKNDSATHLGLVGFHKYTATTRGAPVYGPKTPIASDLRTRSNYLPGPYEVELSIPDLKHTARQALEQGQTATLFKLPAVQRDCTVEAVVSFSNKAPGSDESAKAIEHAKRKTWTTNLALKAPPPPPPPPSPPPPRVVRSAPKPEPVPEPQVREVVREIHHYHEVEKKPEEPPYTVEKAIDGTGRTVWRIKMRGDQNAFSVDREVHAQLLQELRDDFAGRNPNVPRGEINAWATYTTEDGGRTLVYEGEASSLIPKLESLRYDAATRRGEVTMRLTEGADLRQSKDFVRRNISAIVCDKNVVLTGERPPDGARYRSLDENFADGVLTVEFEAVE